MKTDAFRAAWLDHYWQNVAVANVGDASGLPASATLGSLYASLHTAFPGFGGNQSANESAYTGYSRQAIARDTGIDRTGDQISNAAQIQFGEKTGGADEQTWFVGIGRQSAGATELDYIVPMASDREMFTAAVDDNIAVPNMTLAVDDRVAFFSFGEAVFPTGLTEGQVYFVLSSAAGVITVAATSGGAAINITAAGGGIAYRMTGRFVNDGTNPTINAGALLVNEG